jgi:hypothetical protein
VPEQGIHLLRINTPAAELAEQDDEEWRGISSAVVDRAAANCRTGLWAKPNLVQDPARLLLGDRIYRAAL